MFTGADLGGVDELAEPLQVEVPSVDDAEIHEPEPPDIRGSDEFPPWDVRMRRDVLVMSKEPFFGFVDPTVVSRIVAEPEEPDGGPCDAREGAEGEDPAP